MNTKVADPFRVLQRRGTTSDIAAGSPRKSMPIVTEKCHGGGVRAKREAVWRERKAQRSGGMARPLATRVQ